MWGATGVARAPWKKRAKVLFQLPWSPWSQALDTVGSCDYRSSLSQETVITEDANAYPGLCHTANALLVCLFVLATKEVVQ